MSVLIISRAAYASLSHSCRNLWRWLLNGWLVVGITGCSVFGPTDNFVLARANGESLPATIDYSPGQVEAKVLEGKLELLPPQRFRLVFLKRYLLYDGTQIVKDTLIESREWGTYSWTDSTLEMVHHDGRGNSYRISNGGKTLFGHSDLPFLFSVEFVRH